MLLMSLLLFFSSSAVSSQKHYCSEWTQQPSVSCIFAGQNASLFQRQCENTCWLSQAGLHDYGPGCDLEQVCYFENPKSFEGGCSKWVKWDGVTCYNPNSNSWEQQWGRACTVGLKETWCSNDYPGID